jgi:hypothetical protein
LAAGLTIAGCFFALSPHATLRAQNTPLFLGYFTLAALAYTLVLLRLKKDFVPLWLIWLIAFAPRLVNLHQPPTLSDDAYRYAWEGHLLLTGVSPYAYPPSSPALDPYHIPERFLLNNNWMASPYLPAAQVYFAAAYWLSPGNIHTFQLSAMLADLACGLLVLLLLRQLKLPQERLLIYLWHPLVIVEFSHGAHVDAWMNLLILLAFWFSFHSRLGQTASPAALAAAVMVKPLAGMFVPLFLPTWRSRGVLVFSLAVLLVLVLFSPGGGWGLLGPLDGTGLFGAIRIYLAMWIYNSSLYQLLEGLFKTWGLSVTSFLPFPFLENLSPARLISTLLWQGCILAAGWLAWKNAQQAELPQTEQQRRLLALATLPAAGFVISAMAMHPWYITGTLPFLVFLLPPSGRMRAPAYFAAWVYLSLAIAASYLTYSNPPHFADFEQVRYFEYLPFYLLLLTAGFQFLRSRRQSPPRAA